MVLRRVVVVVVHTDHEGRIAIARRRRDDHLACSPFEVECRLVARGEDAGGLDYHVDAEVAPGQVGRTALGQDADLVAVDDDPVVGRHHLGVHPAVHRIVGQQERHRVDGAEIVDGDELEVRSPGTGSPEEVSADAAETVHTHADGHRDGASCGGAAAASSLNWGKAPTALLADDRRNDTPSGTLISHTSEAATARHPTLSDRRRDASRPGSGP